MAGILMETRAYSGICVGGPKDGRHVSGLPSSTLLVAVEKPLRPESAPLAEDDAFIFYYRHTEFAFGYQPNARDDTEIHRYGFWVPEGEKEPQRYVLETLANHYKSTKAI